MNRRDFLKFSAAGAASAGFGLKGWTSASAASQSSLSSSGFKTGAAAVADALKAEGVGIVCGIPGVHSNELWDAVKDAGIQGQLVSNELCASFMADGYARSHGAPGVIAVVPGPGFTNAASGIGEAFLDSVPMVILLTAVNPDPKYNFRLHEIDQVSMATSIVKSIYKVQHVSEVQTVIHQAFEDARSGEPGPVAVEMPMNLYSDSAMVKSAKPRRPEVPDQSAQIEAAVQLLAGAGQVGLYIGAGCFGAGDRLIELATLLAAPVGSTVSGKGAFPEMHSLSVGFGYGRHATPWSEVAIEKIDTLLAIGVKFSEVATGSYAMPRPRRLIHVDINPNVFNQNYKADVVIQGDAGEVVERLLSFRDRIRKTPDREYLNRIKAVKRDYYSQIRNHFNDKAVNPKKFIMSLREALGAEDIVVCDEGSHTFYAIETFEALNPRTFLAPVDFGCMGYSVPAAIGAKLAFPGRKVVTITGDGSFLMTGLEVLTAARCEVPIKVFLFSDDAYNLMQKFQLLPYGRTNYTKFLNPDFNDLARSFRMDYFRISNDYQIERTIYEALVSPKPALVEVDVDYSSPLRYVDAAMSAERERFSAGQVFHYVMRGLGRRLIPQKND